MIVEEMDFTMQLKGNFKNKVFILFEMKDFKNGGFDYDVLCREFVCLFKDGFRFQKIR